MNADNVHLELGQVYWDVGTHMTSQWGIAEEGFSCVKDAMRSDDAMLLQKLYQLWPHGEFGLVCFT